jgi:hypothetical protein
MGVTGENDFSGKSQAGQLSITSGICRLLFITENDRQPILAAANDDDL